MTRRWVNQPIGARWGEFGDEDQIGRMNLLTPQRRLGGVHEVRDGLCFTLGLPLDYPGGTAINANRQPPKIIAGDAGGTPNYHRCLSDHEPLFRDVSNDDAVLLHTQYSTQWDALAHFGMQFDADGDGEAEMVFYNGFRAGEHILHPDQGGPYAHALSIDRLATAGVQGRGVLVDLAEIYGDEHVRIGFEGLMQACDRQKVSVLPGDFLCIRTGYAERLMQQDKSPDGPGLRRAFPALDGDDARLLQWIGDSGIVAICADNPAVEYVSVRPRHSEPHAMLPLHEHCLFKLGVHLGELWWFGELQAWLRDNGRNAFLLTAPPLRLPGCVGSPVTPIATV